MIRWHVEYLYRESTALSIDLLNSDLRVKSGPAQVLFAKMMSPAVIIEWLVTYEGWTSRLTHSDFCARCELQGQTLARRNRKAIQSNSSTCHSTRNIYMNMKIRQAGVVYIIKN